MRSKFVTLLIMFSFMITGICFAASKTNNTNKPQLSKKPVILITDMGFDDWLSIISVIDNPNLQIKAVIVNGTGEVNTSSAKANITRFLAYLGIKDVKVAISNAATIGSPRVFPDAIRSSADTFYKDLANKYLPGSFSSADDSVFHSKIKVRHDPVDLMASIIEHNKGQVSVLCLAPMTDLTDLILKKYEFKTYAEKYSDIDVFSDIKNIYAMGGAIIDKSKQEVAYGNLYISNINPHPENKYAEWNIYCDATAANMVFSQLQKGVSPTLYLVPLNSTRKTQLSQQWVDKIYSAAEAKGATKELKIYSGLLKDMLQFQSPSDLCLWDVVAGMLVDNNSLAKFEPKKVHVPFTDGDNKYGATVLNNNGDTGYVEAAIDLDNSLFYQELSKRNLSCRMTWRETDLHPVG